MHLSVLLQLWSLTRIATDTHVKSIVQSMKHVDVACSTPLSLPVSRRVSLKTDHSHSKASWLFSPEVTTPPVRSILQSQVQQPKRRSVPSTLSAVQGDVYTTPVQEERHTLPDGTRLEILRLDANKVG